MTERNNEISEMNFDELEQVSGGSIIDRIVDAYLAALGARLLDAVHQPLVSPPKMTLHMR
jgi:bacteriocin-like protein